MLLRTRYYDPRQCVRTWPVHELLLWNGWARIKKYVCWLMKCVPHSSQVAAGFACNSQWLKLSIILIEINLGWYVFDLHFSCSSPYYFYHRYRHLSQLLSEVTRRHHGEFVFRVVHCSTRLTHKLPVSACICDWNWNVRVLENILHAEAN